MNVNATLKGMRVLRFKPAQPDDTRGHRIAAGSIGLKNFASKSPIVEDGAGRCIIANLLFHGEVTQRSCHSSPGVAKTKHGGGHRVRRTFPAVLYEHQFLVTHADDKMARCVDPRDSAG